MFDGLIKKVTDKMGHSVKTTIEPIKKEVQKTLDNKVDLYSKVLRLAVLVFLFVDGTKRINQSHEERTNQPSQITIYNYMCRKEDDCK